MTLSKTQQKCNKNERIHQIRTEYLFDLTRIYFRLDENLFRELQKRGFSRANVDDALETLLEKELISIVDDGISLVFKRVKHSEGLAE